MKKTLKIISIFIILTIILCLNTISKSEDIEKNDISKNLFSRTTEDLTVENEVQGDAFILCSKKVTINTEITGNLFVIAQNVEITEDANIDGTVFLLADNLKLSGVITQNIFALSNNTTIDETAYIGLDLFLTSGNEVSIPESVVNGEKHLSTPSTEQKEKDEEKEKKSSSFLDWVSSTVGYVIFTLVIFLIIKYKFPSYIKNNEIFSKNILKCLLYGFLCLITIPVLGIILLLLGITSKIGLLSLALYTILLFICPALMLITITCVYANNAKETPKFSKEKLQISLLILFTIVYQLLKLIPVFGPAFAFVMAVFGLGTLAKSIMLIDVKKEN